MPKNTLRSLLNKLACLIETWEYSRVLFFGILTHEHTILLFKIALLVRKKSKNSAHWVCQKYQKYTTVSNTDLYLSYNFDHLLHATDLFECYCLQNYTTISNTDLYLSNFDLSYVFPGHNDSVKWGLTVLKVPFNLMVRIVW